jgi:hypothetical protein
MPDRQNKSEIDRSEQTIQNWSFDEDLKILAVLGLELAPNGQLKRKISTASTVMVDEPSASVTYIGIATMGASTSDSVWQIRKIEKTGNVTSVLYADNDDEFDNEWDERTSYF